MPKCLPTVGGPHLWGREKRRAVVLFVTVSLVCSVVLTGGAQGAQTTPRQVADEMLQATRRATEKLRILAERGVSQGEVFGQVKAITESHIRAIAGLEKVLNGTSPAARKAFFRSAAGKRHVQLFNEELSAMKSLATELTKHVADGPPSMGFGSMSAQEATELLEGPEKWPSETRQTIESKYAFLRAFLLGVTNFSVQHRTALVSRLEQLRSRAINGDRVATAKLNGILHQTLEMYPKDQAGFQYNLGVLYADIGQPEEAEKWFTKAAALGFPQAALELRKLKQSR